MKKIVNYKDRNFIFSIKKKLKFGTPTFRIECDNGIIYSHKSNDVSILKSEYDSGVRILMRIDKSMV